MKSMKCHMPLPSMSELGIVSHESSGDTQHTKR